MNESCYALDRYKQSLFEFNARGECLSVTETPFMANSIFATSDAFWLYTCFPDANKGKSQMTKVDETLQNAEGSWFPMADFVGNTFKSCFSTDNKGRGYFFYPNDNVVYRLDDAPTPFLRLDFGDRTLPYDRIRKSDLQEYDAIRNSFPYLGFIEEFCLTDSLCRFIVSESPLNQMVKSYQVFVDGKTHVNSGIQGSPEAFGTDFNHLLGQTKTDEWMFSIDTSSIPAFFFDNLKRHCPEIIREDNPFIVFCQLKKTISSDGYEI